MDIVLETAVKYNDIFMAGAKITIIISFLSCFFGLFLGVILAFMKISASALPCSSISTCTPGSVSTSSFFNISFSSFTYSQTICVFSAGIRISASHSLGIALSFNPPCKVRIPNGEREKIPYSRRQIGRAHV